MIKHFYSLLIALFISLAIFSCNKKKPQEIQVFNWTEYIPEEVIMDFEKETGIKVIYSTYENNEAMYAKIKILNGAGYDVAFPSTHYVKKMIDEKLVQPIDKTRLPNFSDMNPILIKQVFDPNNDYSIPFMWGTSGIAVNAKYINPDNVTSWKDLWDPRYKGYVMLQNDPREVFHIGLKSLGLTGNSTDEKQIKEAFLALQKLAPSVRLYNSDSPKVSFLNEEVYIGHIWCGEAFAASNENPDIKYIYPKDGAVVWFDSFVIPSKAKNVDNAYIFIDYIMRPDVSAKISNILGYTSPNMKAKEFLKPNVKASRTVNPTQADLINAEVQSDVGAAVMIYNKYWEKLKGEK